MLDRIEGFKMFLSATEKDRLQRLAPVARTPETYESICRTRSPWAWKSSDEQFSDVLPHLRGEAHEYHPGWYSGKTWDSSRMGNFAGS